MTSRGVSSGTSWHSAASHLSEENISATQRPPTISQPTGASNRSSRRPGGSAGGGTNTPYPAGAGASNSGSGYEASVSSVVSSGGSNGSFLGGSLRHTDAGGYAASRSSSASLSRSAGDLGRASRGSWRRSLAAFSQNSASVPRPEFGAAIAHGTDSLNDSIAGTWSRSRGQSWWGGEAEAASQVHAGAGTGSHDSTPDMQSVSSGASRLHPAWAGDPQSSAPAPPQAWAADTSSGHLDLSSHSSMRSAPPEAAAPWAGLVSSGTVTPLTSLPSSMPSLEDDSRPSSEAAPAAPAEGVWSFWREMEQRSASTGPSGSAEYRGMPLPSQDETPPLMTGTPSGLAPGSPFREDVYGPTDPQDPGAPSIGRAESATSWEVPSGEPAASPASTSSAWPSVDEAYQATEKVVTYDFRSYGQFKGSYKDLKEAMSHSGSVQSSRLSRLLDLEEEQIRSHYGRTRLRSLSKQLDVNAGWDAVKRSARNEQLAWIKQERALLPASSARSRVSSSARLGQWVRSRFGSTGREPDASARPLAPISEDHEVEGFSDEDRAAEASAAPTPVPVVAASTRSRAVSGSRFRNWARKHFVPQRTASRFGR